MSKSVEDRLKEAQAEIETLKQKLDDARKNLWDPQYKTSLMFTDMQNTINQHKETIQALQSKRDNNYLPDYNLDSVSERCEEIVRHARAITARISSSDYSRSEHVENKSLYLRTLRLLKAEWEFEHGEGDL